MRYVVMYNREWVKPNMNLNTINKDSKCIVSLVNSGILEVDFYKYSINFYDAAECIIRFLLEEAAENKDIAKLDLWYFAMVYLYRHSLELLLKACIFKSVKDNTKKIIVENIRHDLKQAFEQITVSYNLSIQDDSNAKWLNDYLSDISKLDKESDVFRYPFGIKFKTYFQTQKNISLVATHANMNKAFNIIKDIYNNGILTKNYYYDYPPELIIEGGNYYQQSVIGYKYSANSFYPYFSSYYEVGGFLKNLIISKNKINIFIPMCYLYRNAIELALKRMIIEDSNINIEKATKILQRKKHSILALWNSIASEVDEYIDVPDGDTSVEDAINLIHLIHNFDKHSDMFRYPCDKKLNSYFLQEKDFDVKNVASCIEGLCNFLDSIDGMLLSIKEYEADMMAEMSGYYDYYE